MCSTYAVGILIAVEEAGETDLRILSPLSLAPSGPAAAAALEISRRDLFSLLQALGFSESQAKGQLERFRAGHCARGSGVACRRGTAGWLPVAKPAVVPQRTGACGGGRASGARRLAAAGLCGLWSRREWASRHRSRAVSTFWWTHYISKLLSISILVFDLLQWFSDIEAI